MATRSIAYCRSLIAYMTIAENLAAIHDRIQSAALRANRDARVIRLMAVSKTVSPGRILEAYAAGQRLFGENRAQEFAQKAAALSSLKDAEFHMIGHLQSNKAAKAAELFHAIDSIDSAKLADRLNAAAKNHSKTLDILLEINIGGEGAKSGLAPDSPELEEVLRDAPGRSNLRIRGLMTVPPYTDDPEGARPYFRKLCELRDRLAARNYPAVSLDELSMGMSHDFEAAIEEGSTCVRIGTAIFGERTRAK